MCDQRPGIRNRRSHRGFAAAAEEEEREADADQDGGAAESFYQVEKFVRLGGIRN